MIEVLHLSFLFIILLRSLKGWQRNSFIISFLAALLTAICQKWTLESEGVLYVDNQDQLTSGTDSQFYYYCALRFLETYDVAYLDTTWGSILVVLYGSIVLFLSNFSYYGFALFNSYLYVRSIGLIQRSFGFSTYKKIDLLILSALPMVAFYNAMLSKEPIYVYIYSVSLLSLSMIPSVHSILSLIVATMFSLVSRPTAVIFPLFTAIIYRFGWVFFLLTILLMLLFSGVVIQFVSAMRDFGLNIALNGIGEDGIDFSATNSLVTEAAKLRGISSNLIPLILPPISFYLSPILIPLWMVSPLPLMGRLFDSLSSICGGDSNFGDMAIVYRYVSSLINVGYIYLVFKRLGRRPGSRYAMLAFIVYVGSICIFHFLESGRHRYLADMLLIAIYLSLASPLRSKNGK